MKEALFALMASFPLLVLVYYLYRRLHPSVLPWRPDNLPVPASVEHDNILDNGLVLLQYNPPYAVELRGGKNYGWLFKRDCGNWVPVRQLETWEIMQAEDQRDEAIVQHGHCGKWK